MLKARNSPQIRAGHVSTSVLGVPRPAKAHPRTAIIPQAASDRVEPEFAGIGQLDRRAVLLLGVAASGLAIAPDALAKKAKGAFIILLAAPAKPLVGCDSVALHLAPGFRHVPARFWGCAQSTGIAIGSASSRPGVKTHASSMGKSGSTADQNAPFACPAAPPTPIEVVGTFFAAFPADQDKVVAMQVRD